MSSRKWNREELILALDLYFEIAPRAPDPKSHAVQELSSALRRARPEETAAKANYRSPDAVVMKLMNFRSLDPAYGGKGLSSASDGDRAVWLEFAEDREGLTVTAARYREGVSIGSVRNEDDDFGFEGDLAWRLHLERERDAGLVHRRKTDALARHGHIACQACGFDFEAAYGERGRGIIECHHVEALSSSDRSSVTRAADLILLCANCHRIVHARRPWLSFDELAEILRSASP